MSRNDSSVLHAVIDAGEITSPTYYNEEQFNLFLILHFNINDSKRIAYYPCILRLQFLTQIMWPNQTEMACSVVSDDSEAVAVIILKEINVSNESSPVFELTLKRINEIRNIPPKYLTTKPASLRKFKKSARVKT